MDRKYLKYLTLLPVIAVMILIFRFSASHGTESGQLSQEITEFILNTVGRIPEGQTEFNPQIQEIVHFLVRKSAHFCEFALLGICFSIHLMARGMRPKRILLFSVLFCAAYAATDEFHQIFVPGRGPKITDVGIDTLGASLGSLLVCLFLSLRRNKKTERASIIKAAESKHQIN